MERSLLMGGEPPRVVNSTKTPSGCSDRSWHCSHSNVRHRRFKPVAIDSLYRIVIGHTADHCSVGIGRYRHSGNILPAEISGLRTCGPRATIDVVGHICGTTWRETHTYQVP